MLLHTGQWRPTTRVGRRTPGTEVGPPIEPLSSATVQRVSRRRIALFGLFGVGNIGNEASLASALLALGRRQPSADVVVVCSRPDVVETQHGVSTAAIAMSDPMPNPWRLPRLVRLGLRPVVETARWLAALRFARRVETIVVPGTGILDDFGEGPLGMPLDLLRWTSAARLARTPLAFVSIGAGPIDDPVSRWLMGQAVRNATRVTYRDEVSRRFMADLGFPAGADAVLPDIALALPTPDVDPAAGRTTVGVGVMAYYGWSNDPATGQAVFEAYVAKLTEITARLLGLGYDVRLLVGEDTDQVAVDAVLSGLAARRVGSKGVAAEPIADFEDLLVEAGRTDAVVATRYHNVVAAMMMGRPVVSIGYAEKNRDLLVSAGLVDDVYHVDGFEVDDVIASIEGCLSRRDEIRDRLEAWLAEQRAALESQFDQVFGPVPDRTR